MVVACTTGDAKASASGRGEQETRDRACLTHLKNTKTDNTPWAG